MLRGLTVHDIRAKRTWYLTGTSVNSETKQAYVSETEGPFTETQARNLWIKRGRVCGHNPMSRTDSQLRHLLKVL